MKKRCKSCMYFEVLPEGSATSTSRRCKGNRLHVFEDTKMVFVEHNRTTGFYELQIRDNFGCCVWQKKEKT